MGFRLLGPGDSGRKPQGAVRDGCRKKVDRIPMPIGYNGLGRQFIMRWHICSRAAMVMLAAVGNARAGQLTLVDDLPGTFIDISKTGGTPLNLGDDEEVEIGTFAGNLVFAPGIVVVANNGGLGFGHETVTDLEPLNEPIPSDSAFLGGQAALAFWDDIDDKEGDVFFTELDGRLIVQWNDRPLVDDPSQTVRFQIQIFDELDPQGVFAQFIFDDASNAGGGASATIGYQDGGAGLGDVEWSFNTAGAVADGTVLSLVMAEFHRPPADLPGDSDHDGDIDLIDFAAFHDCVTGPGVVEVPPGCVMFDFDSDQDVDFTDYGELQLAFTGS